MGKYIALCKQHIAKENTSGTRAIHESPLRKVQIINMFLVGAAIGRPFVMKAVVRTRNARPYQTIR